MCNSPNLRTFEVIFALLMICTSSWVLWRSRQGKIRGLYFPRYIWIKGKEARVASSLLAIGFILLGIFVLLSAVLYLDC